MNHDGHQDICKYKRMTENFKISVLCFPEIYCAFIIFLPSFHDYVSIQMLKKMYLYINDNFQASLLISNHP